MLVGKACNDARVKRVDGKPQAEKKEILVGKP